MNNVLLQVIVNFIVFNHFPEIEDSYENLTRNRLTESSMEQNYIQNYLFFSFFVTTSLFILLQCIVDKHNMQLSFKVRYHRN